MLAPITVFVSLFFLTSVAAEDANEIVRRSAQHDQVNWERAHNYTFQERVEERNRDEIGAYVMKQSNTYETVILYGQPFQRRIEKNDKPLGDRDQKKEQDKFDHEVDKRKREIDEGRASQIDAKERRKRQELRDEILKAFEFKLVGEEAVDGHPAYVIAAEPRGDYRPHTEGGKFLEGLRGKLWIDKADDEWVRIEAGVIRPEKFGLFLMTLSPGSTLYFEQTRVNDEVWLPRKILVRVNGRLVFKHLAQEVQADYRDYRRFRTDTKITGVSAPIP
jgi:hypothetical protein